MAQQTLQTIVSIGGRVDNTFGQIGESLIGLGSQIDMISQKLINIGKESVDTYVNYDDLMREVKAVGEFTDVEIASLDAINSEIAKTTVYSNLQAAEAEVLMGQYGMMIPEIKAMLPSVLELAMAGNISIANSIDYLYSSLMSLGEGVGYSSTLTDQMAKTAAIGATDIDTLGDSLTRLGSGAQMFKGGSVEILAILSEMSQYGEDQRGSIAGTWIRNFMLSLASPMGELDDIIEAMEQLGVAQEEIDEYADSRSSGIAAQAVEDLTNAGLRIYDESGNLLPAIEIIRSLRDAVKGSGEYADDFTELSGALYEAGDDVDAFLTTADGLTDNALYNIFRRVFGRRGVTTALNLISISDEDWDQTIDEIMNSEGFAESMADTMQGGLGGALRELEAVKTQLETTFGEALSPTVWDVADFLKSVAISLDEMDSDTMDALIATLLPIAAAGPALLGAGLAFRMIGYALTPAGGIGLGLIGLVSAVNALQELREADMANNFGDMDMDMDSLSAYVTTLGGAFTASYAEVQTFSEALDGAVESYTTASSTFANTILTDMLTGAALTEDDITTLNSLGEQMGTSMMEGIAYSTSESMAYWKMVFGGEDVAIENEAYQRFIALLEQGFTDWTATAEGLQRDFTFKLNLAIDDDGIIDSAEYAELMEQLDKINELEAQIAERENYIERQKLLKKAQTAGFDDIVAYSKLLQEQRDAELLTAQEYFDEQYYGIAYDYDTAIAEGRTLYDGRAATEENKEADLAAAQALYDQHVMESQAAYDAGLMDLWGSAIGQSDLAGVFQTLGALTDQYQQGVLSADTTMQLMRDQYGNNYLAGENFGLSSDRAQLGENLVRWIESLGGRDALAEKIAYYENIGDIQSAAAMQQLYDMEQLINGFTEAFVMGGDAMFGWYEGTIVPATDMHADKDTYTSTDNLDAGAARTLLEIVDQNGGIAMLWEAISALGSEAGSAIAVMGAHQDLLSGQEKVFNGVISELENTYDFNAILDAMGGEDQYGAFSDVAAAYYLLYGGGSKQPEQFLLEQSEQEPVELPIETDTSSVGSFLTAAQGMLSASPGLWTINIQTVGGLGLGSLGTGLGAGAEISGTDTTGRAGGSLFGLFAEGGRTTVPSIFGEDGAEWAIPEEHSLRTAALLSAAAAGSGFTWPELIGRNGGLNANAGRTPYQLIYSPTIYANDATGVAKKLAEDKERMKRWYEEKQLRDAVEVYQ